jgi:hypothetical protein
LGQGSPPRQLQGGMNANPINAYSRPLACGLGVLLEKVQYAIFIDFIAYSLIVVAAENIDGKGPFERAG